MGKPLDFQTPPRRILFIKPSAIGDIVHALPVLSLVRRRWPEAHIAWMVTPACAGIVDRHPFINEVIRFDRAGFSGAWRNPRSALAMAKLFRAIRRKQFDLVIDLQGLFRSGWLVAQTRAPLRVGPSNAREMGWIFYNHRVPTSWEDHAVDRYLGIADAIGCGRAPVEFPLAVDDADRARVASLLNPEQRIAVLLPGTNWETKRWSASKFASLVHPLRERFGLASVVAGSPADAEMAALIPGALNIAGQTNLRELVALLERAELVIAADTGPMHIAAALGRPLVTMYGPTNPTRTGPYGRMDSVVRLDIPCSPCYSRTCSHRSCLEWLDIEPVLNVAAAQLRNHAREEATADATTTLVPSPGTPGEGQGGGLAIRQDAIIAEQFGPLPSPPPEYREREK